MTPAARTALAQALELAEQGYTCFPCRADKTPSCNRGFKNGSSDADDLRALWAQYPGVLVGVATGPASQIAVLDVDAKHASAQQWWQEHRSRLPATRTHRTRSGGLHLIYGDYDGLRCSVGKITLGIDVRADGGYIIWWPAAGCKVLADIPPAPWPEFLEYLAAVPQEAPAVPRKEFRRVRNDRDPDDIVSRIEGLLRFVNGSSVGERNARVYWAACVIRDMIRGRELDAVTGDEAFEELRQIGVHVGLSNHEVCRTIKSAALGRNAA